MSKANQNEKGNENKSRKREREKNCAEICIKEKMYLSKRRGGGRRETLNVTMHYLKSL